MEFPGWPVGKTWCSQCRGLRFVPGQRPKILHPTQCSLKKKKKKRQQSPVGDTTMCQGDISIKFMTVKVKGG